MLLTDRPAITIRVFADCSTVRGPFSHGSLLHDGRHETFALHAQRSYGPPVIGFPFRR